MPRKANVPLYQRNGRFYLDARAYVDVGGSQEALVPPGEKRATTDVVVAREMAARRIRELEDLRRRKALTGVAKQTTLAPFVAYHLEEKTRESDITNQWLEQAERHLRAALAFFGDVDLLEISVPRVQAYAGYLTKFKNDQGRLLSAGTRRQYLNSLSNLFRRAAGEGYVLPGFNPVQALMHKPTARREEARWLEVPDAALLLESARTYKPRRKDAEALPIYEIIATFLLCGGRESEVLGLTPDDLSFDRRTVTMRPHEHRRLKTRTSHRVVPMWPQLEEILRPYVWRRPPGTLLFPSYRGSKEGMITDLRKTLDAVGERVGWRAGEIRTKMFRHTYCAARLMTLDRGVPVSTFQVAKELGHGGDALVRRVYGHLGSSRHRSDVVEYRVEQWRPQLAERLERLRASS